MKKLLLLAAVILSAFFVAPSAIAETASSSLEINQSPRRIVFRTTQKMRCRDTGEEIWFYNNGTAVLFDRNGVRLHSDCTITYTISDGELNLYLDGEFFLHGKIYYNSNHSGMSRCTLAGDTYYKVS